MLDRKDLDTKLFQDVLSIFPLDRKLRIDLFKMLSLNKNNSTDPEVSQKGFFRLLLGDELRKDPKFFDSYGIHPDDLEEVIKNMRFYITSTKMGVPYISAETSYTLPSGTIVPRQYCILPKGIKAPEGYRGKYLDALFKKIFDKEPSEKMLLFMAKEVKKTIEYLQNNDQEVPYSYWKFIENATKRFLKDKDGKTRKSNIEFKKIGYTVPGKDGESEFRTFTSIDLFNFYIQEKINSPESFVPRTYEMPDNWLTQISPISDRGHTGGGGGTKNPPTDKPDRPHIWEYQDFLRELNPRMTTFMGQRGKGEIKVYIYPNETFGNIVFVEQDRFKGDPRNRRTYVLFGEDYDSILRGDIGEIIKNTHKNKNRGNCFGIQINHDKESKKWKEKVRWLVNGDYSADSPFVGDNKKILEQQIAQRENRNVSSDNPEL